MALNKYAAERSMALKEVYVQRVLYGAKRSMRLKEEWRQKKCVTLRAEGICVT